MANLNVRLKNTAGDVLYPETLAANVLNLTEFIAAQVSSAGLLKRQIVASLPTQDIDQATIYMVLKDPAGSGQNIYNEYMYINSAWELIGDTAVDLTGYATESYVGEQISAAFTSRTTLAAYGITDAKIEGSTITLGGNTITVTTAEGLSQLQTQVNQLSDSVSDLRTNKADKATTLAGYGITDAATAAQLTVVESTLQGQIDTLSGTVETKAAAADLDALETLVGTAEASDSSTLYGKVNGLLDAQITYEVIS